MMGMGRGADTLKAMKPTSAGIRSGSIGRSRSEKPEARRRSRAPTRSAGGASREPPGMALRCDAEAVLLRVRSSERAAPNRRGTPDLAAPGTPVRCPDIDSSSVDHLKSQWERAAQKAKESRDKAEAREAELARLTQALNDVSYEMDALMPSVSPSSDGALTPEPDIASPADKEDDDPAAAGSDLGAACAKKGKRRKRRRQS